MNTIPNNEIVNATIEELKKHNINVVLVDNKENALKTILDKIPAGSEVANGSSTTLSEIGYIDYIKQNGAKYNNLNEKTLLETDSVKQSELRRKSVTADYYLASVNAITQQGQLVAVDATGSRVTAFPYAAKNLILVAGVSKITENLDSAMKRIREHVFPLEDKRMQGAYGMGSSFGKWVIIDNEVNPNRITLILVKEVLGF